jgi:hypothetical protein
MIFKRYEKIESEEYLKLLKSVEEIRIYLESLDTKVSIMKKDMKKRAFRGDEDPKEENNDPYENVLVPESFNNSKLLKK